MKNIFASHLHNSSQAHNFSNTSTLYRILFFVFFSLLLPPSLLTISRNKCQTKKPHVISSNDSPCWPDDPYWDYISRIQHNHTYFCSPKEDPVPKDPSFFPAQYKSSNKNSVHMLLMHLAHSCKCALSVITTSRVSKFKNNKLHILEQDLIFQNILLSLKLKTITLNIKHPITKSCDKSIFLACSTIWI